MSTISTLLTFVALSLVCYLCATTIWSVYFGSLSKVPGPKLAAATRLVLITHKARGDNESWILTLHRIYGDAVRVAPNEISFATGAAWKEIYGYAPGSKVAKMRKDPTFYDPNGQAISLIVANDDDHARQRKQFSHAFSEKALKDQEPLVQGYISQLISNIGQTTDKIDLVKQYNFLTFDIMADFAFGEPLGCLAKSEYISWITSIFGALKIITVVMEVNQYPSLKRLLDAMIPQSLLDEKDKHIKFSADRVDKRLSTETTRPDVWGFVLASEAKGAQLTREEMHSNAGLFMIAGSETAATLLSGLTYYLLINPEKMKLLVGEIRSRFSSADQINAHELPSLNYLTACIQEGLRIYPPVPIGTPRIIPRGGAEICGVQLPEGTAVYIHQLSTYHNPKNFSRPDEFLPQRWLPKDYKKLSTNDEKLNSLDPEEFARDDKSCLQPFSIGPRNCIGINLAWLEIRLTLARVLWHYDLELKLDEGSRNWHQQRVYSLWDKPPLFVSAKPVDR